MKDENGNITARSQYFYDYSSGLPRILVEYDVKNNKTIDYAYAGRLYGKYDDGSMYYYHQDGLGSILAITDASGNVKNNYTYDAFGDVRTKNETISNSILFTGEMVDEAGNVYLRARLYDPTIGRFLTKDTYEGDVNDPQSFNLYTYCQNNPISYVDPTGHFIQGDVLLQGSDYNDVSDVMNLQRELNSLGYKGANGKLLSVDGDFGENTDFAVRQYQADHCLKVDGKVGNNTWQSAFELIGGKIDATKLGNMGKADILSNLPSGWTSTENNGFVHVRDANGTIRIRIDSPDGMTKYDHVHIYDNQGKSLDINMNPVDPKSKDAHIKYKGPKDPQNGSGNSGGGTSDSSSGDGSIVPIMPLDPFAPMPEIPIFRIPIFGW